MVGLCLCCAWPTEELAVYIAWTSCRLVVAWPAPVLGLSLSPFLSLRPQPARSELVAAGNELSPAGRQPPQLHEHYQGVLALFWPPTTMRNRF